ncbi:MAG TPA: tetratricopeptide repeat protein [Candidatus Xenobia bacterium]|nr:tetratricopeptide repeat protein [Candidatus Xenobia bacterium]
MMAFAKNRLRWALCVALIGAGTAAPLAAQPDKSPFHATRYDLEVELQPDVHLLRAQARVELTADEPLAALTLHLNKNLKVEKVTDARGPALRFEQLAGADTFRVELPQRVNPGESVTLTVEYQGAFDPALRPERGPLLASIEPGHSFLLREARWFPHSNNLWDRVAMTLAVTLPQGETAIAPGRAETSAAPGGKTRTVFSVTEPTLAGTLVAGQYEKGVAPGPVSFYLRTVPPGYASGNAETAGNILAFFSDKFGALENPSLAIVEVDDDSWDLYAAPGLILIPTRQWSAELNPRLLARGLAAQWWAARTSPATAADVWLAVGLSRYCEALYLESAAGELGLQKTLEDFTIGALVDESAAPIASAYQLAGFSPEFNSVARDKGAMVFQMLRVVMGDEPFFRLLATYSQRFRGRAATIDDFEKLAEEIHGQPLDYFFSEWLRSTGVPQFEMDWVIYRTQKGFRVGGQLRQQLEIFRMPVPIHIETEGPPTTQTVEVVGPRTDFSIETFGKPTKIEIDPNFTVLKYTPALKLRVAIARGESLYERNKYFEAAREYQRALEVKRNSSLAHYRLGETFFAQRNYQAAANSFREALNGDQEPKWTVVWSHIGLGKIFDLTGQRERAINEYRRAVETNDDTQGAQAEAQKYLQEPFRREERTIERLDQKNP